MNKSLPATLQGCAAFAVGAVLAFTTPLHAASSIRFAALAYNVSEAQGRATLTVLREGDLGSAVTVDYACFDGSAVAGIKYTAVAGTLTFSPNETKQTIQVPLLNNALDDGTKAFQAILSNPTPADVAVLGRPFTATVSIANNDTGLQFQWSSYPFPTSPRVLENAGVVRLGVVRGDDGDQAVTVDVATSDLTALDGVDYTRVVTNLAFAPTEFVKFISVPLLNNSLKQGSRSFGLTLSNPTGVTLGPIKATSVTITDDDQGFEFESSSYAVAEDAGAVLIAVLRGSDDPGAATVEIATSNLTATNDVDYAATCQTVSFAPGEKLKRIPIRIFNDGVNQGGRGFRVSLINPSLGAVLGTRTNATVSIQDNDPGIGFERTTQAVWAGAEAVQVTVIRGKDWDLRPFTVDYATSDGTALAGKDYQAISGTVEFGQNETVKNLTIAILPKAVSQGSGYFRLVLSNPTGGVTLGAARTTVTLQRDYYTVLPPFDDQLAIRREGGVNFLTWAGGGQLQRADQVSGPWQTLTAAKSPCNVDSPVPVTFYRIQPPRPATLYVPSSYDGHTPMPLVVLLHGLGSSGAGQESYVQFRPLAEERGFLYCYPDACLSHLHGGMRCWIDTDEADSIYSQFGDPYVDDTAYLRTLIEEIGRQFVLDPKRVFLFGHSNGGMMVHRMACAGADLIAGIASLAGPFYPESYTHCAPSQPVNVLLICGTADDVVLYWGGVPPASGLPAHSPFLSAVRTAQMWAAHAGAQNPATDPSPTLDLAAYVTGLETVVTRYTSHPPGGAVELWTVNGGSHAPPLSSDFSPRVIDWLLSHPKP